MAPCSPTTAQPAQPAATSSWPAARLSTSHPCLMAIGYHMSSALYTERHAPWITTNQSQTARQPAVAAPYCFPRRLLSMTIAQMPWCGSHAVGKNCQRTSASCSTSCPSSTSMGTCRLRVKPGYLAQRMWRTRGTARALGRALPASSVRGKQRSYQSHVR